jgi:hypothetical protein
MGIEIGDEKRCLEEDEARDPYRGRSAKDGQKLLGGDGLDEEEQKRREKNCAAKKDS